MKSLLVLSLVFTLAACGNAGERQVQSVVDVQNPNGVAEIDSDSHTLKPEQEEEYFTSHFPGSEKATSFKFEQTKWPECVDTITGNYYGYNCTNNRNISSILKRFMDSYIHQCVNEGLAAQGGGKVADLHVVHAGIFADPNHSPRSLHSENRAIDIKSMHVQLTTGAVKDLVYEGTTNRAFYTAFRKCWGGIVNKYNGCPIYGGSAQLTGSIGWENADHQHHMHTSVPYCVSGSYGAYYYQK